MRRYIAVLGFNTKQWWVYDEEKDVYIDIPSEVLQDIHNKYGSVNNGDTIEEQEKYLNSILDNSPSWLQDVGYFYQEIE